MDYICPLCGAPVEVGRFYSEFHSIDMTLISCYPCDIHGIGKNVRLAWSAFQEKLELKQTSRAFCKWIGVI